MAIYEDGTRDCPGCIANQSANPNRVRGDALLCARCERIVHNDVMAGLAQFQPYMRRRLDFVDFLIENGHDPLAT